MQVHVIPRIQSGVNGLSSWEVPDEWSFQVIVRVSESNLCIRNHRTLEDFLVLRSQLNQKCQEIKGHDKADTKLMTKIEDQFQVVEGILSASIGSSDGFGDNLIPIRQKVARMAYALEGFVQQLVSQMPNWWCLWQFLDAQVTQQVFQQHATVRQQLLSCQQEQGSQQIHHKTLIPGGYCEFDLALDQPALVYWRFGVANGEADRIGFQIRFDDRLKDDTQEEARSDPYSFAAQAAELTDEDEENESDVLWYRSIHSFKSPTPDADGHNTTLENGVQGILLVSKPGVITLEWDTSDSQQICSHELAFATTQIKLDEAEKSGLEEALSQMQFVEWHEALAQRAHQVQELTQESNDGAHEVETGYFETDDSSSTSSLAVERLIKQVSTLQEALRQESNASQQAQSSFEAEKQRLSDMCASLQEQCLWKSIEQSDSTRELMRNKQQLIDAKCELMNAQTQLGIFEKQQEQMRSEIATLKQQKRILVQEVKRLQPYSEVNLMALIQDAQEARMVQRNLQEQLKSLQAKHQDTLSPDEGASQPVDQDESDIVESPIPIPETITPDANFA